MFWVYFRGTGNGEHIEAANMKSAKVIFAMKHGIEMSGYIAARKVGR